MVNLFWKTKKEVKSLLATPFKTEEELEKIVFDNNEVLEDIFLIKRQVRGGSKSGIPDIVGIDRDGNICIIEIKNVEVNSEIIPQVLQYAFWAETNPDSIKSLWLEKDERPEDITMTWDSTPVRILIIAPLIHRSTLDLVDKINYPVDLIEIMRWLDGSNELLLVNKLEPEPKKTIKTTSGLGTYNDKFYKEYYDNKSAKAFLIYANELDKYIKDQGWQLQMKFNKYYVGYKYGFFNAFGLMWMSSKTFALFLKLTEHEAKSTKIPMTRYNQHYANALYLIEPGKTKISSYAPLLKKAYKKLTGD